MKLIISLNMLIFISYTSLSFAMNMMGWDIAKNAVGLVTNSTSLQRAIASRTDPDLQEKMVGMQPDPIENAKTARNYDAIRETFGTLTQEELNLFIKRLNTAIPLIHTQMQQAFFKENMSSHEQQEVREKLKRCAEFSKGAIPQAILDQINEKLNSKAYATKENNVPSQPAYNTTNVAQFIKQEKLNESEDYQQKLKGIEKEIKKDIEVLNQKKNYQINKLNLETFEKHFTEKNSSVIEKQ